MQSHARDCRVVIPFDGDGILETLHDIRGEEALLNKPQYCHTAPAIYDELMTYIKEFQNDYIYIFLFVPRTHLTSVLDDLVFYGSNPSKQGT